MQRVIVLCVVLSVFLAACGSGISDDADGATIYASACARCHGADLGGGIAPALAGDEVPSLSQPESYFIQTTSRGNGRMPAFGGSLSEAQIQRVVDFILERQGR